MKRVERWLSLRLWLRGLGSVERLREGVVRSCRLRDKRFLRLARRPWVVTARLQGALVMLLLLLAKPIIHLTVWVILRESSLLGLQELLLLLIESIVIWLLLLSETIIASPVASLKSCLLWLNARRLGICIIEESCVLRLLLWVLIHQVPKPVDCALLLVALVISRGLVSCRLTWSIAKEKVCIAGLKLLPPQFFLLFTKFNCLCEVIVIVSSSIGAFTTLALFFRLVLARFKCQPEFKVFIIITALTTFATTSLIVGSWATMVLATPTVLLYAGNARLP